MNQELNLKAMTLHQLEAVFLQLAIQHQVNSKMLDMLTVEILNKREQPKPNEVVGTFSPPAAKL